MTFRLSASMAALCCCASLLLAQTQTTSGTISGRITDGSTNEGLPRATAIIIGSKKGAVSDPKGRYTIKNLTPGKYDSLKFSYVGYVSKIVTNVEVKAGQTTTINVVLQPNKLQVQGVVKTANRITENQAAVLNERKNAAQVSDGISKEEIKRLPDADAGQALKRVSGVTVVGDKFVYVRGVGDRYNNTTLNGVALTSTEPDKKAFAFDMFPSDLLEQANIAKSFTPDLPANFAGGLVQLSTVEFPDAFSVKLSVSSSANSNVSFRDNAFIRAGGTPNTFLGLDNGARTNLPSDMPKDRREMSALLSAVRNPFDTTNAAERWTRISRSFNNANWAREQTSINLPNGSFSLSYSNLLQIADNDFGIVGSVNYSNSWNINSIARNGILADRSEWFSNQGINAGRSVNWGGLLNLAYRLGENSTLTLKNVYNHSMDDDAVALSGQDKVQFFDLRQISFQYVEKNLFSSTLGGDHTLDVFGATSRFDWKAGYSRSQRDEPDFRRFRYARTTPQPGETGEAFSSDIPNYTPLSQGDGTRAGRFFSTLNDDAYSASLNLKVPISDFNLKLGGLYEQRQRDFKARSFTYVPGPNNSLDFAVFTSPDSVLYVNPSGIFRDSSFGVNGIGISEDSRLADAYDAQEHLVAAYVMGDFPLEIASLPLRVIAGARVEDNTQELHSFDLSDKPVEVNLHTTDVLPALSLLAKVSNEMNLRASASQTLARPSLREFAPFTFYDFATQSQVQGNPNLQRSLIQNYDLRWEWFPAPGEVVSASVFYKNFKNAIEETIYLEQSNVARTFTNAKSNALNYGLELELRKNFDFLGEYMQNMMINLNYSRVFSEIEVIQGGTTDRRPIWGQSPYSFNAGLYFVEPSLGATFNLGYNVSGKRIVLVGLRNSYQFDDPHTYELPRDVVDFSYIQKLGDAFEAKLVVRDLLNQAQIWQQGGVTVASNLRGRTYTLGFSYKLK